MKDLLQKQYERYPKMQIQDMVKLIYQNEFAGGHLITNEMDSLQRLKQEYRDVKSKGIFFDTLFENIGNNLCRFHLAGLKKISVNVETVNRFFVNTANSTHGNVRHFEKKLEMLRQCCRDGALPYSLETLDAYLFAYRNQGYPPVSHSNEYRIAYSPAYRIVKKEYCKNVEVFSRIDLLLKEKETVIVAIDGNSAAGKSTLAALIQGVYDCNVFHMDHYFLRPEQRTKERLQEIGGNVDYERFYREVIAGLKSGEAFQYQLFDCAGMTLDETVSVNPHRLNIIEGAYSMHPTLIDNYDFKIFIHVEVEEQSSRILKRNGTFMHKRFLQEWIPMENRYFQGMDIMGKSDLILNG